MHRLRYTLAVLSIFAAIVGAVTTAVVHRGLAVGASKTAIAVVSSPITITQGGTYTGSWQSNDANTAAVTVNTTDAVVIENCTISSRGPLIVTAQKNVSLTIRNCTGTALNPNVSQKIPGRFLTTFNPNNLDIENNTLNGTSGMVVVNYGGNGGSNQTIKILRNLGNNIDGRFSDGNGGFSSDPQQGVGWDYAEFVQLNQVQNVAGIEIAWNQIINSPGQSRVEDNISILQTSGTQQSPLLIHDNYIQGAYPAHPTDKGYSGGGIMLGDQTLGSPPTSPDTAAGFVHAYNNQVVSSANYGMAIAAGHDNIISNNRVVSTGHLSTGEALPGGMGIYVWDEYGEASHGFFYNDYARDNVIGAVNGNLGTRSDTWFPNCSVDTNNQSLCVNNTSLPDAITLDMEKNEYTSWQQRVSQNRVTLGDAGSGSNSGTSTSSFSFHNGTSQLSWNNTVDSDAYPAGNSSNVSGVCCTISGPETKVLSGMGHSGNSSLMYSGNATSGDSSDFAYTKAFDLSKQNITVGSNTTLSYWVYPQSSQTFSGLSANSSSCVALDLLFTDGTNLRDSAAVDQHGNKAHPAAQCGHLTLDSWNQVVINLAASVNGKTINRIDVGYDQPAHTGSYRGYIDDIQVSN